MFLDYAARLAVEVVEAEDAAQLVAVVVKELELLGGLVVVVGGGHVGDLSRGGVEVDAVLGIRLSIAGDRAEPPLGVDGPVQIQGRPLVVRAVDGGEAASGVEDVRLRRARPSGEDRAQGVRGQAGDALGLGIVLRLVIAELHLHAGRGQPVEVGPEGEGILVRHVLAGKEVGAVTGVAEGASANPGPPASPLIRGPPMLPRKSCSL